MVKSLNGLTSQRLPEAAVQCRRSRERGAVLIEFALSFMLFFIIAVVGVMDFGRAIWAYNLTAHLSRDGARYAMVRGSKSPATATTESVEARVRSQALMLDPSKLSVTTTWIPDNVPGSTVEVQISYDFVPLIGIFQPAAITVSSRAQKVITF